MKLNIDLGELLRRHSGADSRKASTEAAVKISEPRVDLLPEVYRARAQERSVRTAAIAAAVGAAVLVGGGWGLGVVRNGQAGAALQQARATEQQLSGDMAVYAPVTNLAAQTRALTDTIESQAALAVDHDAVLARFLTAAEGRLVVTSLSLDTENGAACARTNPFETDAQPLGCISFSGQPLDVPGLLDALASDDWFVDEYVPGAGAGETITGSVSVTAAARPATDGAGALPEGQEPQTPVGEQG
ncbi:hypothetical protein CHO01_22630 [Cellulomonas hominis]|uniref:Uncharacterized protein n=1 Tax=Cellulomonas hominis TaxID=156981 RepID=A0A511FFN7_9CELL|nr:hypothetical protein [Cellulomonas hominis]MBB5474593.1 hypothetical protein [Cellulomonas hominis]NKY05466.1 hypothetical protein [Cellulomonas hominis]GEL47147.1 hypothetical protein CHO01_22630 [Cellulomonas hominis]